MEEFFYAVTMLVLLYGCTSEFKEMPREKLDR